VLLFALTVMFYGGGRLVLRAFDYEQLSATLALPMGYVYLCIPISGLLIVFYQVLILLKPEQFRVADEVEVALEHIAEEEKKLAAEGIILDSGDTKEKQS
jgi:TRAP-type C4-dicarboxylate transport system permease small subunit